MAKCERCGASFDYDERQGVCPRCCFYNRPPGTPRQDMEWMKYYNVEDNSYQLPKSEGGLEELFPERKRSWAKRIRDSHREKAAHTGTSENVSSTRRAREGRNLASARQREARLARNKNKYSRSNQESASAYREYDERTAKGTLAGKIIAIFMVACVLLVVLTAFLKNAGTDGWQFGGVTQTEEGELFTVETRTVEEAAEGITAGDLTYRVGETRTFFREGELSDLPAGEKCIGIWLEDNESVLDFTGYGWERPYVYDGNSFRRMLDAESLDDGDKFTLAGILPFPIYGAGFEDESGYGIFFVDADATSVTLSLPCQTVNPDDTDKINCTEVIDITIPLAE